MSRPLTETFALFDDARWPDRPALLLSEPQELIEADTAGEIDAAFAAIEAAAARGLTVAGYCAYELGYAFEPRLAPLRPSTDRPLLRFVAFAKTTSLSPAERASWLAVHGREHDLGPITPTLDEGKYVAAIDRVRQLIGDGDVYQVNFTFKLKARAPSNAIALYAELREKSRAGAASFLRLPGEDILSLSPEIFFTTDGERIAARPMKGTAPRAPDWQQDRQARFQLQADEKQRAENLMIVDLLRNDIARVAQVGSVNVTDLFTVETYPRFHTMTSGIEADLKPGQRFGQIMRALFPSGSVTGAPKIRAMEIIRELEAEPRGVYCGAVGYVAPGRIAFNVAIRTVEIRDGEASMGVGGGIVWDSVPRAEYAEALLKGRFFTERHAPFELIETMRWTPQQGFALLDRHIARLRRSASYFGFRFGQSAVRNALRDAVCNAGETLRVRLTLARDGTPTVKTAPLPPPPAGGVWRYAISPIRTDSGDPFYRFKTTNRALYDDEHARLAAATGCDEVIFLNERGELTEGSRTNLFIERDGVWLTPPLSAGVLDGCLRRELIERANPLVEERTLTPDDLRHGHVWLGNALRGVVRAVPIGDMTQRSDVETALSEPSVGV